MSRIAERKNSIVMNSTGAQNREISKGNISFIMPNEQPNTSEVNVAIDVKDIRFSHNSVTAPEVTGIVNGSKVIASIPFKEPLNYQFKRIEEEMVFKFAVTSAGDLLGFIYLEIPQKFKTTKKFKIDDWFPVKHLPSEENEKMIRENFVARVSMEYTGSRKLEDPKPDQKLPKARMIEEMTKNMKQKIAEIKNEVDQFDEQDEFKHLKVFEKKLLKKKVNLNSKGQDPKKPIKLVPPENKNVHQQVECFGRTKTLMQETNEVKVQALTPAMFYDRTINFSKTKDNNTESSKLENVIKELNFSHNELVNAHQKIMMLEQGKLIVDNEKLKKDMEKLSTELNKDRKEINIKMQDATILLEQETLKTKKYYETETEKVNARQVESKSAIDDLKAKLAEIENREEKARKDNADFKRREELVVNQEKKYIEDKLYLEAEQKETDDKEMEMSEIKTRMMLERQRVCEETNQLQFLKGDTELCNKQIVNLDNILLDEKESFRKFVDKKSGEIDIVKQEIDEKHKEHDLMVQEFERQQQELEDRNKELLDNIYKHKQELAKFARDKKSFEEELVEFKHDKRAIDKEKEEAIEEVNKDNEYLEEKIKELDQKKAEFEQLSKKMTEYEISLQNQSRVLVEQNQRFIIQQKQFFKKINDTNFDSRELKKLAAELDATIPAQEEAYEESQKQIREIAKSRIGVKKTITTFTETNTKEETVEGDKKTGVIRRYKNKNRQNSSNVTQTAEQKIKIQQEAFTLVEEIFNKAVLTQHKKYTQKKDDLIENLKLSVVKLQNKLIDMTKNIKNSKLSFFMTKSPVVDKVKVISNPFADPDLNDSVHKHGNLNDSKGSEDEHQVDRLGDLQENIEDFCDSVIQQIQNLSGGKITPRIKERIEYLIETRKVIQKIFGIIKHINSKNKDIETSDEYSITYMNFDLVELKDQLEGKLKTIIAFISKVRENSDFFNTNIDGEIIEN